MVRYYCSGFDVTNIFGHGLGKMLKAELNGTKSIVFVPGSTATEKIEKAKNKHSQNFINSLKSVGIEFETVNFITPDLLPNKAKEMVKNANFIILMGGDPFKQKEMCEKLGIMDELKKFNGVMLGFSAGAMLMSKYIIITPCSEEYPDFHIGEGLNLDGISIFPHNNTANIEYPDELISDDEVYKKSDLIKVAKKYGKFYLLQDNKREEGLVDVSLIKSTNGKIEFYTENDGKIWEADKDVNLITQNTSNNKILKTPKISKEY